MGKTIKLTYDEVKERIESKGWKLLSEDYKNARVKLKMECPNSHIVEKTLDNFKNSGCSECRKKTQDSIKQELAKEEYKLLSTYKGVHEKILVQCPKGHEPYEVMLCNWRNGRRCPKCNESHGERKIRLYLEQHMIEFIPQYKFKNCIDKDCLPFDFYIPSMNLCIEFDGELHYKPIKRFGGEERFKIYKLHDEIKNTYCKQNNIRLIRIPYWEIDNIENILNSQL